MLDFLKKRRLKKINSIREVCVQKLIEELKKGIRNLDYINSKTWTNIKGETDFVIELIYTKNSGESFYECLGSDVLTIFDYMSNSELLNLVASNFVDKKRILRRDLVFIETNLDLELLSGIIVIEDFKRNIYKYYAGQLYPCLSAKSLKLNNFRTIFPDLEKKNLNIDELKKQISIYKTNINETLAFIDDIDFSIMVFEFNEVYDEIIKDSKYEKSYKDFKELFNSANLIIGGFIKDKQNKELKLNQLKDILNKCDNILKKES